VERTNWSSALSASADGSLVMFRDLNSTAHRRDSESR
jgi:hypothetical protein